MIKPDLNVVAPEYECFCESCGYRAGEAEFNKIHSVCPSKKWDDLLTVAVLVPLVIGVVIFSYLNWLML